MHGTSTMSPNKGTGFPGGDNAFRSFYGEESKSYDWKDSQFSGDPREDRARRNWRLINQAKLVMQKQRNIEEKKE